MRQIIKYLGLLVLIFSLGFSANKMEVWVYFNDPDELFSKMGELFGELDICTVQQSDEGEYYLVLNTTREQFEQIQKLGFKTRVTYEDIAEKFYEMAGSRDPQILRDFGYFYTYWEMRDTLQTLANSFPQISRFYSAGNSYQGLQMVAFKISDNPLVDEMEPAVCFNGATHAREPMGTTLCIDYIKYLLINYGTDSLVTWFVNNREIYFIPVMNPDGYRYNSDSGGATSNIRKNRHFYSGQSSSTAGVDLNRNYGYKWGYDNYGSSPTVTSDAYRGPARFSEPETQNARDFFLPKKIRTQIDYHSYGAYNLCVWGYSGSAEPIPDSITQWEILDSMRAMNGFSTSRTGPIVRVLYAANGTSIEWEMKDTLHNGVPKFVTYAFSIETNQTDFWEGYNNYTVIQNNINQCRPVNIYFTKIAGVFFDNLQPVVADTALGNGTGQLDPNETSHLWMRIRNRAIHPLDSAYNITATLVSLDTQIVVQGGSATFPKIYRKSTGNNSTSKFLIRCSPNATPGAVKQLKLILTFKDDTCTITQGINFSLTIGNNPVGLAESEKDRQTQPAIKLLQNPAKGLIEFEFAQKPLPGAVLNLYDASGRLVKTFEELAQKVVWNGTDQANMKVESGVYFYMYNGSGRLKAGKFILIAE
uniref:carboxypeptidase T n=1 Tax=candidate division WOR-3 bacterium TaxID=2052148 RepID=A0A7V1EHG1_UNCW3